MKTCAKICWRCDEHSEECELVGTGAEQRDCLWVDRRCRIYKLWWRNSVQEDIIRSCDSLIERLWLDSEVPIHVMYRMSCIILHPIIHFINFPSYFTGSVSICSLNSSTGFTRNSEISELFDNQNRRRVISSRIGGSLYHDGSVACTTKKSSCSYTLDTSFMFEDGWKRFQFIDIRSNCHGLINLGISKNSNLFLSGYRRIPIAISRIRRNWRF
jgi:hypothetical protein